VCFVRRLDHASSRVLALVAAPEGDRPALPLADLVLGAERLPRRTRTRVMHAGAESELLWLDRSTTESVLSVLFSDGQGGGCGRGEVATADQTTIRGLVTGMT
jgi:hypothetical protein